MQGLYAGLNDEPYSILPEAFIAELRNLRENEVINLFGKIGLPDLGAWLTAHPALMSYCLANECTVTSRLKDLVEFRNDAAHGAIDVDEVLGISRLLSFHEFVGLLCESIAQFTLAQLCRLAEGKNLCKSIGRVSEYFAQPGAAILTMEAVEIGTQRPFILRTATECHSVLLVSLQVDGESVECVQAQRGQEVGAKFDRATKVGCEVLELSIPEEP